MTPHHLRKIVPKRVASSRRDAVGLPAFFTALALGGSLILAPTAEAFVSEVIELVQPKIVKIYGAGGLRNLEAYQSGILISGEGHVLSARSYVLDGHRVTVVLDDGQKYDAELVGADPSLDVAVLKIDAEDLPYFKLDQAPQATQGTPIWVFSNVFGIATGNESPSVISGWIAAKTVLTARRGVHDLAYQGPVYLVDAITNNPGGAGGALTNRNGQLLGMLGKELRDRQTQHWINYAIPVAELAPSVANILAGRASPAAPHKNRPANHPHRLNALGIVLVPDVLAQTPPFIDIVGNHSVAALAGLRPDDLIVFLNGRLIQSSQQLRQQLATIESEKPLELDVMREQQMLSVILEENN